MMVKDGAPHVAASKRPIGLRGRFLALVGQRSFDRIGRGTVIDGRAHVVNDGFIEFGTDGFLSSHPIQSHLLVMPGATLTIGDRVHISYGAGMSALNSIEIGDDTRIGPLCMILDNDFHKVGDLGSPGLAAPVKIGRAVRIGARVTLLRGARIGDGARIVSGSTVSGVVPAGATVDGVPGKESARKTQSFVLTTAMRIFALERLPRPDDGPAQLPGWTACGAMRLMVALEESLGISLAQEEFHAARSLAEICALVATAHGRAATTS